MGILRERQIAFKVTVQEKQHIFRIAREMNTLPSRAIREIIFSSDVSKEVSDKFKQIQKERKSNKNDTI